jgi:hypothetical protein
MQGAIEVQSVQGAIEVVKRFETWFEAIGLTVFRGWSVCEMQRSVIVFKTGCAV